MYLILKENNFPVEVKVSKLVICNLLLNRNSLSYTILHSKYALHTWWPTVLWVLLELVLYLSMLSERFPCFSGCLQWGQWVQLWFRHCLNLNFLQNLTQRNHLALKGSGMCCLWHRIFFCPSVHSLQYSGLFAFSSQLFLESGRNYFLYLSWNCFSTAYSHGLSASLKIGKTEPLACFTCGCFTFKAIIFPLKTFPFRLYSKLIMSR